MDGQGSYLRWKDVPDWARRLDILPPRGARVASAFRDRIVIGLAHCKRESWVLAGFDPVDETEEVLLQTERQNLGFDPRNEAHQLTAKHDRDLRSAKRVVTELTRSNPVREANFSDTPLETLKDRGEQSGLADFLKDVEKVVVPLFRR